MNGDPTAAGDATSSRLERLREAVGDVKPRLCALAADEYELRTEHVRHIGDRAPEGSAGVREEPARRSVALGGECPELLDSLVVRKQLPPPRFGDERGIADDRLETAVLPAAALSSALDGGRVAELARAAAEAAVDVPAGNDAETDAGADGDGDEIVRVAAASVEALRDRERVDVVVREHEDPEPVLEDLRERDAPPAEHRRVEPPSGRVDDAGDPEADAEERCRKTRAFDPARKHVAEVLDRPCRGRIERLLEALPNVGLDVDEHADEMVRSDLDAKGGCRSTDELEEQRGSTPPGLRPLGDPHEALIEQLAGDCRDRRRAQAEPTRDLRPGDRPRGPDEAEDRRPVEVACQAGGGGAVRRAGCRRRHCLTH